MCASWVETTKDKEKEKKLDSRAECLAFGRLSSPTKVQVKEQRQREMVETTREDIRACFGCGSTSHFSQRLSVEKQPTCARSCGGRGT